jgi:hypothetical protein
LQVAPGRKHKGRFGFIAPALAVATPALAQSGGSTLIVPLPGGTGYSVIPPQGFSTTVLPLPGG